MGFEKKSTANDEEIAAELAKAKAPAHTVKMKYVGHFIGVEKVVQLPIPLIAKSQQLEERLAFKRTSERQGPGFCDVPMEWAGALMDVGGNWKVVEELTPELTAKIKAAQVVCAARMDKFALENELVDA